MNIFSVYAMTFYSVRCIIIIIKPNPATILKMLKFTYRDI